MVLKELLFIHFMLSNFNLMKGIYRVVKENKPKIDT